MKPISYGGVKKKRPRTRFVLVSILCIVSAALLVFGGYWTYGHLVGYSADAALVDIKICTGEAKPTFVQMRGKFTVRESEFPYRLKDSMDIRKERPDTYGNVEFRQLRQGDWSITYVFNKEPDTLIMEGRISSPTYSFGCKTADKGKEESTCLVCLEKLWSLPRWFWSRVDFL